MKKLFLLPLVAGLFIWACAPSANSTQNGEIPEDTGAAVEKTENPTDLLPLADAQNVLGTTAHLTDSSVVQQVDTVKYFCAYTADTADSISNKTGSLYFALEHFVDEAASKNRYNTIKTEDDAVGLQPLADIGDEAYFYTDGERIYHIMARKGVYVFDLRVNEVTNQTSRQSLMDVAQKIANQL